MANIINTMAGASPAHTINLGNITSTTPWITASSVSLSDFDFEIGTNVKKYQVCEIEEDLLALSVAWKRLRDEHKNGAEYVPIAKLLSSELFKRVNQDDRRVAADIRDYYSKKIMLWKLKGQPLTKFREDMNSLIHSDGRIFKEEMCPLAFRLPEFHEYDTGFDSLVSSHNKVISKSSSKEQKVLKLQKTFNVYRRHTKTKEYWFTDDNDNLVRLGFSMENPLLSLLDNCSLNPLSITGLYNKKTRDNVDYYTLDKYKF